MPATHLNSSTAASVNIERVPSHPTDNKMAPSRPWYHDESILASCSQPQASRDADNKSTTTSRSAASKTKKAMKKLLRFKDKPEPMPQPSSATAFPSNEPERPESGASAQSRPYLTETFGNLNRYSAPALMVTHPTVKGRNRTLRIHAADNPTGETLSEIPQDSGKGLRFSHPTASVVMEPPPTANSMDTMSSGSGFSLNTRTETIDSVQSEHSFVRASAVPNPLRLKERYEKSDATESYRDSLYRLDGTRPPPKESERARVLPCMTRSSSIRLTDEPSADQFEVSQEIQRNRDDALKQLNGPLVKPTPQQSHPAILKANQYPAALQPPTRANGPKLRPNTWAAASPGEPAQESKQSHKRPPLPYTPFKFDNVGKYIPYTGNLSDEPQQTTFLKRGKGEVRIDSDIQAAVSAPRTQAQEPKADVITHQQNRDTFESGVLGWPLPHTDAQKQTRPKTPEAFADPNTHKDFYDRVESVIFDGFPSASASAVTMKPLTVKTAASTTSSDSSNPNYTFLESPSPSPETPPARPAQDAPLKRKPVATPKAKPLPPSPDPPTPPPYTPSKVPASHKVSDGGYPYHHKNVGSSYSVEANYQRRSVDPVEAKYKRDEASKAAQVKPTAEPRWEPQPEVFVDKKLAKMEKRQVEIEAKIAQHKTSKTGKKNILGGSLTSVAVHDALIAVSFV